MPPESNPTKCIIYTRVSSQKQVNEGSGLGSQERTCRDYAERQGYEVIEVAADVISGRKAERPGMQALLHSLGDLKHNTEKCVVIVDDISRFARDVSTHTALRDKIVSLGAKIESPTVKFGHDASGKFMELIMAAIAEHDSAHNAERSHRRTVSRLKLGFWTFSSPLGYDYTKAPGGGKLLVRIEPLATHIQGALQGFADGRFQSPGEVKRLLESKPDFPKKTNGESCTTI